MPYILQFFGELLVKSGSFLAKKYLHSNGNNPSKFPLFRFVRIGGVNKQTNTDIHKMTDIFYFRRRIVKTRYNSYLNKISFFCNTLHKKI